MMHEHRLLSFAAGEMPKPVDPEKNPQAERPRTMEERAQERLRRMEATVTPDNVENIVDHAHLIVRNETVTPEILEARKAMVESAKQDIAPMLTRLRAVLSSGGITSPEANAIMREIMSRLNAPLNAEGRDRASTRTENDAIAIANAVNGIVLNGTPDAPQYRLRAEAMTDLGGRWQITASIGLELR